MKYSSPLLKKTAKTSRYPTPAAKAQPLKTGLTAPRKKPAQRIVSTILHQFAESLGSAIDAKDPFTSMHSDEVAEVSKIIALGMGMDRSAADVVHVAGHLHDIGKIGLPDKILKKPGTLSVGEWKLVRQHPKAGADIIRPVSSLCELGIVDIVMHHHERYDGKGYPSGLRGNAIPMGARIIALADSLSAILQNRPYRAAQSFPCAVKEIVRCSGTQFDPVLVEVFMDNTALIEPLFIPAKDKDRSA